MRPERPADAKGGNPPAGLNSNHHHTMTTAPQPGARVIVFHDHRFKVVDVLTAAPSPEGTAVFFWHYGPPWTVCSSTCFLDGVDDAQALCSSLCATIEARAAALIEHLRNSLHHARTALCNEEAGS